MLLLWAGNIYLLAFVIVGSVLGVYLCGQTARDIGEHDHGAIVWDEIIGFMLTMLMVPISVSSLLLGFVLFRFFDIVKPWPIRWFDRNLHGGLGVMMDDIVAGVLACLLLHSVWLPLQI